MLLEIGFIAKRAICLDRQHANAATGKVGDQHEFAALIDDEMTGVGAMARLAVEVGQRTGLLVDTKSAYRARRLALVLLELVDAIEELPFRVEGEIRRISHAFGDTVQRQLFCGLVEFEAVDALALTLKHL